MKEKIAILLMFFSTYCYTQLSTNPSPFEVNQSVTITVDINSSDTNCNSISNPDLSLIHI